MYNVYNNQSNNSNKHSNGLMRTIGSVIESKTIVGYSNRNGISGSPHDISYDSKLNTQLITETDPMQLYVTLQKAPLVKKPELPTHIKLEVVKCITECLNDPVNANSITDNSKIRLYLQHLNKSYLTNNDLFNLSSFNRYSHENFNNGHHMNSGMYYNGYNHNPAFNQYSQQPYYYNQNAYGNSPYGYNSTYYN